MRRAVFENDGVCYFLRYSEVCECVSRLVRQRPCKDNFSLPPANKVWGKVMFSHLFGQGGGGGVMMSLPSCYGQHHPLDSSSLSPRTAPPRQHLPTQTAPPTGQQAGSTHPTSMLSCFLCYEINFQINPRNTN